MDIKEKVQKAVLLARAAENRKDLAWDTVMAAGRAKRAWQDLDRRTHNAIDAAPAYLAAEDADQALQKCVQAEILALQKMEVLND